MNKLALMTEEEEDCFILKSTDPNQCIGFICQAPTASEQNQWLATIQGILDKQRDFVNAIQSPIAYQKEQTKEAWVYRDAEAFQKIQKSTLNMF